jgi:hypothetical protein
LFFSFFFLYFFLLAEMVNIDIYFLVTLPPRTNE